MESNGISCEDVNECEKRTHNCDQNAVCTNFVQTNESGLNDFVGYTCQCNSGKGLNLAQHQLTSTMVFLSSYKDFVGNGYICMVKTDGIESRMLVADNTASKCRDSVLNRLDLFLAWVSD